MRVARESPGSTAWQPPSTRLRLEGGVWQCPSFRTISYPEDGNDACRDVEADSYWFAHRNACILHVMQTHPPGGAVYDVGGGNGFVSLALQSAGHETVLVEPGPGAFNAAARGVARIVHASLEDAEFTAGSLDAVGAFDVVEHVEDHHEFLRVIRRLLRPGGRFYCTVPALEHLWSDEDVVAGHFRRYSPRTLAVALHASGLRIEFLTPIFTWLVVPVFLHRALPYRVGFRKRRDGPAVLKRDHSLPRVLAPAVHRCHIWELDRLAHRIPLPFGTSLLCVATRPPH